MVPVPALFVLLMVAVWLVVVFIAGPLYLLFSGDHHYWRNVFRRHSR